MKRHWAYWVLVAVCIVAVTGENGLARSRRRNKKTPVDKVVLVGDAELARQVVLKEQLGKPLSSRIMPLNAENPPLKNAYLVPLLNTWTNPAVLAFYVITDKQVIYPLSDVRGPNHRVWTYVELVDLRVEDVNRDGFKDILVLARFFEKKEEPFLFPSVYLNDQRTEFALESPTQVCARDRFSKMDDFSGALKRHYAQTGDKAGPAEKFEIPVDCTPQKLVDNLSIAACFSKEPAKTGVFIKVADKAAHRFSVVLGRFVEGDTIPQYVEVQLLQKKWIALTSEGTACSRVQIYDIASGRLLADSKCTNGQYCSVRALSPTGCQLTVTCGETKELKYTLCSER